MLRKIRDALLLLAIIAFAITPFIWPQNAYATDPVTVTDANLLAVLAQQHISASNVKLAETATADHPYSEVYISAKDNKAFQVFSQLPKVNAAGQTIQPMWIVNGQGAFRASTNTFTAVATNNVVVLQCINDQSWGAKKGQTLTWNPQVFVGDQEHKPTIVNPQILPSDPINPDYTWNTVQWDYGVCVRQLRLIEGSIIERWVFTGNPGDTVRIVHNQTGFFGLKLGLGADEVTTQDIMLKELPNVVTYRNPKNPQAITQDVEVFYAESFNKAVYPLRIGGSATFYPGATALDGYVRDYVAAGDTWANIYGAATGTLVDDTGATIQVSLQMKDGTLWSSINRGFILFDTSSLPDSCTISSAVISLYGSSKANTFSSATPYLNIYSSSPASSTSLSTADFDQVGTTEFSTDKSYASWSTSGYNDFTLNASGRAAISKTAVSQFSARISWDADNSPPSGYADYATMYFWSLEKGTGYKPTLVVTYIGEPTIVTDAASGITSTSANLNGNITSVGAGNATMRGFVRDTVSHPVNPGDVAPAASGYAYNVTEAGNFGTGGYTLAASPLGKYVTYYVRSVAQNIVGYAYGNEISFTTLHDAPTVTTNAATSITSYSAVLHGSITDLGGYGACTQYKFEWGLGSGNYTVGSWTSAVGAYGLGDYDSGTQVTGLIGNTTYHFIFSALNAYGWGSGNDTTFTTLESVVTVVTVPVTEKTDTTAVLNGNITNTGAGVIIRGVYWGTTSPPTNLASESGTWYTNGVYSLTVTGLSPDTVYYCQAHIQDINGNSSSGVVLSFLTLSSTWAGSPFSGETDVWSPLGTVPTQPAGWNLSTTPAFTNSQLPGVDFFTSVFSDSGYPVSFMWWLMLAIGITFLGILVYEISSAVLVIFMLGILCLAVICSMGWLDWWVIAPYVMWGLSSLVVERQFGF